MKRKVDPKRLAEGRSKLKRWHDDPVVFVRESFGATPDAWQEKALASCRDNPRTAMSACKGPGKSCTLAWLIWWFLSTRIDAQLIVLSVTADNLKDNLWKELSYWAQKAPILTKSFKITAERITSTIHPKTWWASARAFSQSADITQQANTLAGFHGAHIMVVLDEVGDYPDGVVVAAEAIFANENIEAKLVVAGNPTDTQGPLYRITERDAKRWNVIYITGDPDDPYRSPRIGLEWAKQQIEDWGIDNPWVRVNVLGKFPQASADQLISQEVVRAAQQRRKIEHEYNKAARVWGLDPARFGDDEAVLFKRQGSYAWPAKTWRNKSGTDLASLVAAELLKADGANELPDTLFCDVGGQGAACYEHLVVLGWGHIVIPVDFGGSPDDERFLNKRAEMWWRLGDWLKTMQPQIPADQVLASEMPAPKFFYRVSGKRTKFVLESKDDMKKRGVTSPNRADALALTFAGPVAPRSRGVEQESIGQTKVKTIYNPLDRADQHTIKTSYDVFGG